MKGQIMAMHEKESTPSANMKDDFYILNTADLQNSLADVKRCLDRILEMRAKCSELTMNLSCLNNPELLLKILKCHEVCTKCEELLGQEELYECQVAIEN